MEKFASQITDDIQKVLSEFGHEIKNLKTAIAEIRSYKNEIETKLETNKAEPSSRLAALEESKKEN